MEPAAGGPWLEGPEGAAGLREASMDAPGVSLGPEEYAELRLEAPAGTTPMEPPGPTTEDTETCKPGLEETEPPGPEELEPCKPEKLEKTETRGPEELEPCKPEKLEKTETRGPEELEPCEPEKVEKSETLGPEEVEPCEPQKPGPEEPSEPEVAAGPPQLSDLSDPGFSASAPTSGVAGEEAASGRDGAADEERPASRTEEITGPTAPTPAGGAERRNGEAPEEPNVAEESEEERRERAELLEELCGISRERDRLRKASTRPLLRLAKLLRLGPGERREWMALGAGGAELYAQRWLRQLQEQGERAVAASRQREAQAQAEWEAFLARKKAVAISSVSQRLGDKEAVAEAVEHIQARERDTERQLREARVENIKLKHEIQNLETILKAQGELVKGQHGIDFEHMKKQNQKHSDIIDEFSNEILKLKEKISKTAHILNKVKEKLQFLEAENECRKAELMHIEAVLSQKTHILTKTKQARDRLRECNLKLQQKCGLLGNEILLRDFERKVDTAELLNEQLKKQKCHHAALIRDCKGIQKKMKEANSSFLAEDDSRKESMDQK